MSASLQAWQQQLEVHFERLAEERDAKAPLFALEHPLSADQLKVLGEDLKDGLKFGIFSNKHWLAWVVYAAELGYVFEGEEYWQTFSEATPHWQVPGQYRRRGIRKWFVQFQKRFHGVTPSGAWSRQFINITWPITHAVLPKDLQYYFARGLWSARYRLAADVANGNAEAIGRIIRAASDDASSRFRQFAQQEGLVGRLALALLDDTRERQDDLLSAHTLDRIVRDLERTRNAREWLQETRRQVYRFKGTARPASSRAAAEGSRAPGDKQAVEARPSIRPTLELRRTAADQWQLFADLPSFAPLAMISPQIGEALRESRCTIKGGSGTWHPRGWLLASSRLQPLRQWPADGGPLVDFEQKHKGLELVLQVEGKLGTGPIWPCLISTDGVAREILGGNLRCGYNYLLLHVDPLAVPPGLSTRPARISCAGIDVTQLDVPATVTAEQIAAVEKLGLRVTRSVRLWPAGLLPRRWDGDGHGEWLTTERPSFGLIHDSPVDRYLVSLNGGDEICVRSRGAGLPSFLQLPPLPVGVYRLRVRAVRPVQPQMDRSATQPAPSEGEVVLNVREPSPLATGSTPHGGLSVTADPPLPDLDDLLNDKLVLSVQGPAGRKVSISVAERTLSGEQLWKKSLGERELPAVIKSWTDLIDDASRLKLEAASTAQISVGGDDLGEYQLRLQHDVAPLRWTCSDLGDGYSVRLIDEAGFAAAQVSLRRFASPLRKEALVAQDCHVGVAAPEPGGLFLVESPMGRQGLVVSVMPRRNLSLADLKLQPQVDRPMTYAAMTELLIGIELWSAARVLGPLAPSRRAEVVHTLRGNLIDSLCSETWRRAEGVYQSGAPTDDALMVLGDALGADYKALGFAAALRQSRQAAAGATADRLRVFTEICQRFFVCNNPRVCELSLRIASNPATVRQWAGADLDALLAHAVATKLLFAGARLAVLAAADPECKQKDPAWNW